MSVSIDGIPVATTLVSENGAELQIPAQDLMKSHTPNSPGGQTTSLSDFKGEQTGAHQD